MLLNLHWRAFFACLFTLFGPLAIKAQVNADFTANTTEGCGPLVVNFQNLSTNATSYQWNLGNGNTSTAQNPSAIYTTPGTYHVTLTATGPSGTDTEIKNAFINVFTPPAAAFTPSQTIGCFPLPVSFTDQSQGGSSPITTWNWDFGDGGTSSQQNPSHTYALQGSFNVTLILNDANGCSTTQVFNNVITTNSNRPTAAFTQNTVNSCQPPVSIQFTNQSSGGTAPLIYNWSFGDGGTSTAVSPLHIYNDQGSYNVSLTVTDVNGCQDVLALTDHITIANSVNVDFIAVDNTVCAGEVVEFVNQSTLQQAQSWLWDFGDGNTSTDQSPTHVYASPGAYTITLNAVYDAACTGQRTRVSYVAVSPNPTAAFTANNLSSCNPPLTVNFTNQSSGAGPLTYAWTFGPSGQSSATNPNRTFNNSGSFDVSLTTTNSFGCTSTLTQPGYINVGQNEAQFTSDVTGFCAPLPVNFSNQSVTSSPVTSFLWNFGDGSTSTQANPSHTYTNVGVYNVTLSIQTAEGCSNTFSAPAYISVSNPPTPNFSVNATEQCSGSYFQFTDMSINANTWFWDFGNGETSTDQNPQQAFNTPFPITVSLTVTNNGCPATLTQPDLLTVLPPYVNLSYTQSCQNPLQVQFSELASQENSYFWTFGDGTTSLLADPSHLYQSVGVYPVTLTVNNTQTGCTNTATDTVIIASSTAGFAQDITQGCGPLAVAFSHPGAGAVSWQWDFGDGATSLVQNPTHTYNDAGSYNVTLTVTDAVGCVSTTTVNNAVTVQNSAVNFSITNQNGCDQLSVSFQRQITPPGSAASVLWDFGDGTTSTQNNPTHVYTTLGEYDVTLTVTNTSGCISSITQTGVVQFNGYPTAALAIDDTTVCIGDVVNFTDQSQGSVNSYLWNFGDGATSISANATHNYTNTGNYNISLTVTSALGCADTITISNGVVVTKPTAQFTPFPTFAFCPPLMVNFNNQSTGAATYLWDFGDGTFSSLQNPSHIYTESGTYTIQLIAFNADGCTDTIIQSNVIQILGPVGDFSFTPTTPGCAPHTVEFTSNTTGAISYTWDFGDGFFGTEPNEVHDYQNPGSYVPVLILQDNNNCTFVYQSPDTIHVFQLVIDAGLPRVICEGDSVNLTASGSDTYLWFPPNSVDDPNAASVWARPAQTTTYTVTGYIGQCFAQDTVTVFVNPLPSVSFNVADVCLGSVSNFFNTTTIPAPASVATYNWDLVETTSSDVSPTHIYSAAGTYLVTLTATSADGCTTSQTKPVVVNDIPNGTFSVVDVCDLQQVTFTDLSTVSGGVIATWQWNLGDGSTSIEQNPTITYNGPGDYTATLIVTASGGCSDTVSNTVTVYPLPVAQFVADEVCQGLSTTFTESSTIATGTITTWQWIFGDGANSGQQNPTHTYGLAGTYVAALTVTSDQGCENEFSSLVEIRPLPAVGFILSDTTSCTVPVTVAIQNITQGGNQFSWSFGNGLTATSFNASTVFNQAGVYPINLLASNQYGCEASLTSNYTVFAAPTAVFATTDLVGCQPHTVAFTNNSVNSFSYEWQMGDSGTSTESAPVYTYQNGGVFSVTLIATGEGNCTDTLVSTGYITVHTAPTASFEFQTQLNPVADGTILFLNTSSPHTGSFWDFDGLATSNQENPTYKFPNYGSKQIMLAVVDANGCVDTLWRYIPVEFFGGLHVPNALTMTGGNAEAQLFLPKGTGLISYRLQIFDEWGNTLFESTKLENGQPAEGWDGTYLGKPMPQGAYVWKIDAVFGVGTVWEGNEYRPGDYSRTGSVTVLY